ncbi:MULTISPECIES: alpha/beta hydrolase [unclassified Mesobacillus]|uniref:alpha/beta fold hydrolase n=1 Tax=unclassified Mesobacillus TaxID=2675270 RepID=UPI00203AC536|nr:MULTISPECIES: alpha/beta hydrolase [unclassified Mesobacillus]MCM3122007.1 alpha/beta hydrolase [Mesobacillus sp. MER 33]MCM3231971.1 alpha/beta hydrolase [Mesobacillus sp. MER 48]
MPVCKLDYGDIFYEEAGEGVPIIFLHPPGMGRKVFHYQRPLSERFRLIFPDLSGHGESTAVPERVTIQKYAEEVLKLADWIGLEEVILCGYSSGGSIAQEFALTYPERTKGLILSGGFAEVKSPALRYEHLLGMYFVKHSPKTLAKTIATAHTFDPEYRSELIEHMLKTDMNTWFHFYYESLNYSCVERLKSLSVPLLLIYGSKDLINQHLRTYEKELEHFETAIIPKVSHQVPVKRWQDFNKEITSFLLKEAARL